MDNKRTYEAMFLLDSGNPDFNAVSEPIRTVLERRGAEILSIKPWDERKLAYEIRGRKRGLYILTYFKIDPSMIVELEHDFKLDERILRAMFLRRDKITDEKINAETPAMVAAQRNPEEHEEGEHAEDNAGDESASDESKAQSEPDQPQQTPAPDDQGQEPQPESDEKQDEPAKDDEKQDEPAKDNETQA